MTIDQQLRAALSQEAEMQTVPPPDVDRLIIGGKVRRRRRNVARVVWVGVAAAVAVLVAGGVYGVVKTGSGNAVGPATTPPSSNPSAFPSNATSTSPDTYRMDVGTDRTNAAINADLTFYSAAWQDENFPVLADGAGNYGGIAVYQPIALGGGTGCLADNATTQVGDTPQSIAEQLAQLPRSTVLNPPRPVQALGRPAVHVRVRINNDCGADVYRVAVTTERGGHGISYGDDSTKNIVVDFWVMDVGGSPVVVETWHEDDASSRLMQEIAHTFESVTFVTGG